MYNIFVYWNINTILLTIVALIYLKWEHVSILGSMVVSSLTDAYLRIFNGVCIGGWNSIPKPQRFSIIKT